MLSAAQARKREGVDVVVGVVETHGRNETEALLDGLEVLPRRAVGLSRARAGRRWTSMRILARRPQLALVDELAHSNAPGSRHPKRYMDVEELLAAGIDVYTTLNVQHVESLNDVVARITRIRVRETVPDSIIDKADDIELIDLTPEDLIQRLKDGKVYVPHQAERAVQHYFSPGNLTALRELALRRTAQRVDEQMVRLHAGARDRGALGGGRARAGLHRRATRSSTDVVRYAKRMADSLQAPWTAIHVETGRSLNISDAERDRIAEALRLARAAGRARPSRCRARMWRTRSRITPAPTISPISSSCSRRARCGASCSAGRWRRQLIRKAGGASVHVVGRTREARRQPDQRIAARGRAARRRTRGPMLGSAGVRRGLARRRACCCTRCSGSPTSRWCS